MNMRPSLFFLTFLTLHILILSKSINPSYGQEATLLDHYPGFDAIINENRMVNRFYQPSFRSEAPDDKVYYRNLIRSINQSLRTYQRSNPNYYELCLLELIRICDLYQGHLDFIRPEQSRQVWHSGNYINQLDRFYSKSSNADKIDFKIEWMMERHVQFQKSELFFGLPEQKKLDYLLGVFRMHHDQFVSLVLHKSENIHLREKLFDYQLAFKGNLMLSEIKMKQKIKQHNNPEVRNMLLQWQSKKDSLVDPEIFLEEWQVESIQQEINQLENQMYYISETGRSLEEYEGEGSVIGAKKIYGKDTISISWKEIQSKLKNEEAIVEIVRFNKYNQKQPTDSIGYLALIIDSSSTSPKLIEIKGAKWLETSSLKYYRNNIKYKVADEFSYVQYWQPIQEYLDGQNINKIILSNDGVYHSINIQTLLDIDNLKYVSDYLDVVLVPNSKVILNKNFNLKDNFGGKNVLLFGYPDYYHLNERSKSTIDSISKTPEFKGTEIKRNFEKNRISELPGTKLEVEAIKENLNEELIANKIYLEKKATEEALRKSINPGILHIATHGYFLNENAQDSTLNSHPLMRSGLLFTGCNEFIESAGNNRITEQDGILTAYEAMSLNLIETNIVILSACETALGEIQNGEGVIGFQRALMLAGAEAIIMTLWTVDDNATKDFMISFYQNYVLSGNKRQAFKVAQNKLMTRYDKPYYWGAFVMIQN